MALIQLDPTQIFIAGTLWAGFWAGVGWWANYKVSAVRDRRAREYAVEDARNERKRNFLSFIRQWRIEIIRQHWADTGDNFSEKVLKFEGAAENITGDYAGGFEDLVRSISSMRNSEVASDHGKQKLVTALDVLKDFVKSN